MNAEEQKTDAYHPEHASQDLVGKKRELNTKLIQQALEQADPMRASLRVATAELMDMASQIKGSIDQSCNANANSVEALKTVGPAYEQFFKCLRQADRFVHLDAQLGKPEK